MATDILQRKGFVLVSILWITAMLSMIALGFGRRAALDRRAAAYSLDHAAAMMMARGAVDRGIVELYNRGLMTMLLPEDQRGGWHLGESWAQPRNLYEEKYFDQSELFANDIAAYKIIDEERYININVADEKILEEIEALKRPLIRRIMARRTEEVHEKEGVTPFSAIEELRYLRGIDEDDWFGTQRTTGLRDLLTVWGMGRINVNSASAEVLACIPGMREADINIILTYRAGGDGTLYTGDDKGFKNMEDLTDKTGVTGATREALDMYCTCDASCFRITGMATRRQGRIRAVCSAIIMLADGPAGILDWQEKTLGS